MCLMVFPKSLQRLWRQRRKPHNCGMIVSAARLRAFQHLSVFFFSLVWLKPSWLPCMTTDSLHCVKSVLEKSPVKLFQLRISLNWGSWVLNRAVLPFNFVAKVREERVRYEVTSPSTRWAWRPHVLRGTWSVFHLHACEQWLIHMLGTLVPLSSQPGVRQPQAEFPHALPLLPRGDGINATTTET